MFGCLGEVLPSLYDLLRRPSTALVLMALTFSVIGKFFWHQDQLALSLGTRMGFLVFVADDFFFFSLVLFSFWALEKSLQGLWIKIVLGLAGALVMLFSVVDAFWLVVKGEPMVFAGLIQGWTKIETTLGIVGSELTTANRSVLAVLFVILLGLPLLVQFFWKKSRRTLRWRWSPLLIPLGLTLIAGGGWVEKALTTADIPGWQMVADNGFLRIIERAVMGSPRRSVPTQVPDPVPPVGERRPASEVQPDILIFLIESTQYHKTSLADAETGLTPFLLELASQGCQYTSVRSPVQNTTLSLLTALSGRYPGLQTRIVETSREFPLRGLPAIMREHGYATAFFESGLGAWDDTPRLMHRLGFESFFAYEDLCPKVQALGYLSGDDMGLVKPVVAWAKDQTRPFFMVVFTSATHHPYIIPDRLLMQLPLVSIWSTEQRFDFLFSEADRVLRLLTEEVDAIEGRAKPFVIVSGDHGQSFGEKGKHFHDSVYYESGIHLPFVLRALGVVAPGSIEGDSHSLADLSPTVLDLAGIPYLADRFEGQSILRPAAEDKKNYFACWLEGLCVGFVQGKTKFVYLPHVDSWVVYDLKKDPNEVHPLIDSPTWRWQADEVAAWYEDRLYGNAGLTWPAVELFGGRWRCGEGQDQCKYAGPSECPSPSADVERQAHSPE